MTKISDQTAKKFEDFVIEAVDSGAVAKGQNTRFMLIGAIKALAALGQEPPTHWEMVILSGKEFYAAIQERRNPPQTASSPTQAQSQA